MKKVFLTLVILIGLVPVTLSQEFLSTSETLKFQSETEKTFWQSGGNDAFFLFRAVHAEQTQPEEVWINLLEDLDNKASKKKSDILFLRQIFERTHHKLLKKYEIHSSFNSMLTEGKFDCVSGTAALGLLLERYGYDFEIIETDHHVFILVSLGDQKVILESTFPIGGMIFSPAEVRKYLDSYKPAEFAQLKSYNQSLAGTEIEFNDNSIFKKVTLRQLAGLQYYNDAIVHFNSASFIEAVNQLSKAYLLYPSDRILGLRELSIDMAYKTYGYELKK
ncbi:hypothetical protein [Algoriphagus sp.]|uniref:hypothetical protein n=1 Tax=Algoriphagus sp. TaxID=1872435 RepID=UPI00391B409B